MARETTLYVRYHCPVCDRGYSTPDEVEMCIKRHERSSMIML